MMEFVLCVLLFVALILWLSYRSVMRERAHQNMTVEEREKWDAEVEEIRRQNRERSAKRQVVKDKAKNAPFAAIKAVRRGARKLEEKTRPD